PPVEEWQIRGILAALKDGHEGVRARAARKLAELLGYGAGDRETIREWKSNARTLANGAVDDLRKLLRDKCDDKDVFVPAIAAAALGRSGDTRAVPELFALLEGRDTGPRVVAAEALALLGDQRGVPALVNALKGANYDHLDAAEALGRLGAKA